MAMQGMLPGAAGGAVTGQRNMGVPVQGNFGGLNQFSPGGGNPVLPPATGGTASLPGLSAVSSGVAPNQSKIPIMPPAGGLGAPRAMMGPIAGGQGRDHNNVAPATGVQAAPPVPGAPSEHQQQQLQKQLIDIYGKGTGGELANLINNLGSGDSQYMQAYQTMMAGVQAQGLSTIGTQLGNAGISSDSSTAAIEKASYLSQLGAQSGMQEQQLLQREEGLKAELLSGTQEAAAQETGTSWLDTLGQVAGIAGTFVGDATGLAGLGNTVKGFFGGSKPQNANINPGSIPGLQSYDPGIGI